MSSVLNGVTAAVRKPRVDVGHTPATTSVSVPPVTMVADYVMSATVRMSLVAMTMQVATHTVLQRRI